MAFSGGSPSSPQINVTPLIDVLLVLIIMFMIVVAQEKTTGDVAQIPQPTDQSDQAPPPSRTIVIQVVWAAKDQQPTLKVNTEEVAWGNLHDRLERIFLSRAEKVAFVKGDDDLNFEYVAQVIDIARNSGVDRVGLLGKDNVIPQ